MNQMNDDNHIVAFRNTMMDIFRIIQKVIVKFKETNNTNEKEEIAYVLKNAHKLTEKLDREIIILQLTGKEPTAGQIRLLATAIQFRNKYTIHQEATE